VAHERKILLYYINILYETEIKNYLSLISSESGAAEINAAITNKMNIRLSKNAQV